MAKTEAVTAYWRPRILALLIQTGPTGLATWEIKDEIEAPPGTDGKEKHMSISGELTRMEEDGLVIVAGKNRKRLNPHPGGQKQQVYLWAGFVNDRDYMVLTGLTARHPQAARREWTSVEGFKAQAIIRSEQRERDGK